MSTGRATSIHDRRPLHTVAGIPVDVSLLHRPTQHDLQDYEHPVHGPRSTFDTTHLSTSLEVIALKRFLPNTGRMSFSSTQCAMRTYDVEIFRRVIRLFTHSHVVMSHQPSENFAIVGVRFSVTPNIPAR